MLSDSTERLSKELRFNSRYRDTPAFKTAFAIIKGCGDSDFYYYVRSELKAYLSPLTHVKAKSAYQSLEILEPKNTNVEEGFLETARYKFSRTMEASEGYDFNARYEDMSYAHQVFFCLVSAFDFFAEVQRIESAVLKINDGLPEFVEGLRREKEYERLAEDRRNKKR